MTHPAKCMLRWKARTRPSTCLSFTMFNYVRNPLSTGAKHPGGPQIPGTMQRSRHSRRNREACHFKQFGLRIMVLQIYKVNNRCCRGELADWRCLKQSDLEQRLELRRKKLQVVERQQTPGHPSRKQYRQ